MTYERQYTQGVGWENEPSVNTPINAENLNQMDQAIMNVDAAVAAALVDVSAVVANPSGSASTNLNKLKVGNTIYSVPGGAREHTYVIGRDDLAQVIQTSKTTPIELSVSNFSRSTGTLVFFRLGRAATLDWEPSGVSSSDYGLYFNINDTGTMQAYHDDVAISGASVYNLAKEKLYVGHLRAVWGDPITWRFEIHEIDDMGAGGGGGTGKVFSGLLGGVDGPLDGSADSKTLTNYLELSVDPSFELVDGAMVMFRRANHVGFSDQVQEGAQLYFNVNNTGAKVVNDSSANRIYFSNYVDMNNYFAELTMFTATYHVYEDGSRPYDFWEICPAGAEVEGSFAGYDSNNNDLATIKINGVEWNIHPTDVKVYVTDGDSNSHVDSDSISLYISEWREYASENSVVYFKLKDGVTVDWVSNGLVITIKYGLFDTMALDVYYHGTKVTDASIFPIVQNAVYMLILRADQSLGTYVFDIFDVTAAGGSGSSTLAGLTDTTITSPANKQILRYDNATSKWINGKNSANAFILNTGTTDTTGYTIDVDGSLATVEVGDIVEIKINANYTFEPDSGAVSLSRAWGLSDDGSPWAANNVLQQVAVTEQYTNFKKNLKKGDSIFTVCTGFYGMNLWPQLLVVAIYNADGTALGDLNNVDISTPTDGQYLKYDSATSKWINASGGGGGGSSTLAGLDDTTISSPTDAQPLTYDNATSKWVNGGVIPTANGGTGNADGYIRTGKAANSTAGERATIEGLSNAGTGKNVHVEGTSNTASANEAHAEGSGNTASGVGAHAEGTRCTASGQYSHAEGYGCQATQPYAHAQGNTCVASSSAASAAGFHTTAGSANQFVVGKYNDNKSTNIFEVGIGTANNAKANGLELDSSGNLKTAGTITDGNGNVLGGGGSGNKVVKIDISGSSAVTAQYFSATLSAVPSISVGDILVLAIHCNHTFNGGTGAGWGLSITVDSSTTTWGSNLFRNYPEQTSSSSFFTSVFKDSFVPTGKVFTFVCTEISGTTPQFLMIAEENAQPEEQTVTLSTSSTTTVTFTRDDITTASVVEVGISEWGLVPDDVTVSSGSCTVTLPAVDSAHSVVVKLYVR